MRPRFRRPGALALASTLWLLLALSFGPSTLARTRSVAVLASLIRALRLVWLFGAALATARLFPRILSRALEACGLGELALLLLPGLDWDGVDDGSWDKVDASMPSLADPTSDPRDAAAAQCDACGAHRASSDCTVRFVDIDVADALERPPEWLVYDRALGLAPATASRRWRAGADLARSEKVGSISDRGEYGARRAGASGLRARRPAASRGAPGGEDELGGGGDGHG